MSRYLIAYLACAAVFFPVDVVWLSTVGRNVYIPQLGDLVRERPDFVIAGLFYLAYLAGVVLFAVHPATSLVNAMLLGAALGFIAYGTYDLTNLATLRGYPPAVAALDIAWGTVLTAITAGAGWWALDRFG